MSDAERGTAFAVVHPADVSRVARAARDLAEEVGLDATSTEEVRLVAHELLGNVLRHASGGRVVLRIVESGERRGVEMEVVDGGPGIPDVDQALEDGFSTAGGPGYGLGTADRMCHELSVVSPASERGGTRVVCRRWAEPPADLTRRSRLSMGAVTRPRDGLTVNGDAFLLHSHRGRTLVGVIDGVGHGAPAHEAAETARRYLCGQPERRLPALFAGVARCCRPTRGVVMALARIDEGRGTLRIASVGNIEARTPPHGPHRRFVVRRGILGGRAPAPVVTEHPWTPEDMLVLHSDGLSTSWTWDSFDGLWARPAPEVAHRLLQQLADGHDDATIVVVQGRAAKKR